jgi:uncharacterized membrane protein YgcG
MLNELASVCDWLRGEREQLIAERTQLQGEYQAKETERSELLRKWVSDNLPDLNISTIDTLARTLPGFVIPTTSFFGFFRKVAGECSLGTTQIALRRHIESVRGSSDPGLAESARMYSSIKNLDTAIHEKSLAIAAIDRRLAGLEQLRTDEARLKPEAKERVARALRSQLDRRVIDSDDAIAQYDEGVDVLELWLWHQILFSSDGSVSELYIEPEFTGGGGESGGGGASGSWTSDTTPSEVTADPVTGMSSTDHEVLGSASFS